MVALHAPAVPGNNVTLSADRAPKLDGLDTFAFGGSRFSRAGFHIQPYNQRKARKLARNRNIHPANPKRR